MTRAHDLARALRDEAFKEAADAPFLTSPMLSDEDQKARRGGAEGKAICIRALQGTKPPSSSIALIEAHDREVRREALEEAARIARKSSEEITELDRLKDPACASVAVGSALLIEDAIRALIDVLLTEPPPDADVVRALAKLFAANCLPDNGSAGWLASAGESVGLCKWRVGEGYALTDLGRRALALAGDGE